MTDLLFTILITPLEYLMDVICYRTYQVFFEPVITLLVLSVCVNVMTIPFYNEAERLEKEEKNRQNSMAEWIKHIRSCFKGDERSLVLNRYYRIKGYNPIYSLKGSISLFLQIPFFIAAYDYISGLKMLRRVGFLAIRDLALEDGLIVIGDHRFNLLPLVMTLINVLSGVLYTQKGEGKKRVKLMIMAFVFMLILYRSPSGLVLYWTFNNLFSLIRNVYRKKIQNKKLFIVLCLSVLPVYYFLHDALILEQSGWYYAHENYFLMICCPLILYIFQPILSKMIEKTDRGHVKKNESFLWVFLVLFAFFLLYGVLIPLSVVSASAADFVNLFDYRNPLLCVAHTVAVYAGFFLVWGSIIYLLSGRYKKILFNIMLPFLLAAVTEYIFFGKGYGSMNGQLKYDMAIKPELMPICLNSAVFLGVFFVGSLCLKYAKRYVFIGLNAIITGMMIISVYDLFLTGRQLKEITVSDGQDNEKEEYRIAKEFSLDRNGKNVIVLMLDRAISSYLPYIFNEKPEVKDAFDGFTWYPDTLSYGYKTIFASAPLFGGYEYRPAEINVRDDELLMDKHDEALRLMPVLFGTEGYDVTVCDVPYGAYSPVSDLSIFENDKNVKAVHLEGQFGYGAMEDGMSEAILKRKFVLYSIFRTCPLCFSAQLYDDGNYQSVSGSENDLEISFIGAYLVLDMLPEITEITENGEDNCLIMANYATHEPSDLQLPDYVPSVRVDNSAYDMSYRMDADGNRLEFSDFKQDEHYKINMAALIKVAEFLDYMRQEKVYDNTRIIIVADHGWDLGQIDSFQIMGGRLDITKFNPLLLVKDFNSKEFSISDEFMTNADVPLIAMDGLISDKVNPFTGNLMNADAKKGILYVTDSSDHDGTHLDPKAHVFDTSDAPWYSVHDSIFDESNWAIWKERGEESR